MTQELFQPQLSEAGRVSAANGVTVRFWGVRGTVPCPGPDTVRYGGNTACVELRCGGRLLILDGGTGLRPLGEALRAQGGQVEADLFLTHTHLDHILGLPFFAPAHAAETTLRLWAGNLLPGLELEAVLQRLLWAPFFPVPADLLRARLEFRDFVSGDTLHPHPGITVRTAPLSHPDRATGYRVEHAGRSVAYVTDTEHEPGRLDANVLALVARADTMIYDTTYTDEEFPSRVGWGHSTWQEGVRLADAAGVGRLVLFHHDPSRGDAALDRIAAAAAARRPGTLVAGEGMVIEA
jgi:phosphoribosyl 1,2-cyclic phosphodiesterase